MRGGLKVFISFISLMVEMLLFVSGCSEASRLIQIYPPIGVTSFYDYI